jgi:hypothetical protein
MVDDDECGAVGGMSGKGNRSTRRKEKTFPHRRFVHHKSHMTLSGLKPRATPPEIWHGLCRNTHWEVSFFHSRDLLLQEGGSANELHELPPHG